MLKTRSWVCWLAARESPARADGAEGKAARPPARAARGLRLSLHHHLTLAHTTQQHEDGGGFDDLLRDVTGISGGRDGKQRGA